MCPCEGVWVLGARKFTAYKHIVECVYARRQKTIELIWSLNQITYRLSHNKRHTVCICSAIARGERVYFNLILLAMRLMSGSPGQAIVKNIPFEPFQHIARSLGSFEIVKRLNDDKGRLI